MAAATPDRIAKVNGAHVPIPKVNGKKEVDLDELRKQVLTRLHGTKKLDDLRALAKRNAKKTLLERKAMTESQIERLSKGA